jgi:hypothetical protein
VSTDPKVAARLQTELGRADGLPTLLAADGPTVSRWDVKSAADRYRSLAHILALRPVWEDQASQALVTETIPALFDLLGHVGSVTSVGYLHDRYYVEQVTYQ